MAKCALIKDMWSPIYLANGREQIIRYTLKNLLIYFIFLFISSALILGLVPYLRFHFTKALRQQLIEEEFTTGDDNFISFSDIQTPADLWKYLEEIIEVKLYNEYWYGWTDQVTEAKEDDRKVLFENKLLGVPRLRQLRVRNDSCKIHEEFKKSFSGCYAGFSKSSEEKISFGLEEDTAWLYHEPKDSFFYYGRVATYHTGGYYQDLGLTRNKTAEIVQKLKENLWITRNTRVIFLDFTVYNGNVNLFCIIKLVFEFPPTGGIITSSEFYSTYLIRYVSVEDYILLALEMTFVLFIIYYTFAEIQAIKYHGKQYFKKWWNYVELFILLDSYVTIGFSIFKYFYVKNQIEYAHNYPENYTSYEIVGFINMHVNNILAVILFILWIKIFRFINLSRTLGQLNNTLSKCAGDIFGFSLMFFIIFIAFAQMGYLLFGAYVEKFSTIGNSALSLLMTILGEFEYYEIERTNKILAPIFFITYIFLVFFVLFNMFLAIITDTYSAVKEEINLKQSELGLGTFIMRAPKKIFRKCRKKTYQEENKSPGNEMIQKIRDVLELCNFTDTEIKAFFSMYNINENDNITEDDINNLLANIRRANKGESSTKKDKHKIVNRVSMEAFIKQQEKLEKLEKEIQMMNKKVDEIVNQNKAK